MGFFYHMNIKLLDFVLKKMHIKDFKHVQMIPTTQFSPAFVNNASKQNLKKTTVGVVRIIEAGVDIILL